MVIRAENLDKYDRSKDFLSFNGTARGDEAQFPANYMMVIIIIIIIMLIY
jgi:hypothetical protein